MVSTERSEGGRQEEAAVGSTGASSDRPLDSALPKNHSYGRRSAEVKTGIGFHVVKRFLEGEQQLPDSGQQKPSVDQTKQIGPMPTLKRPHLPTVRSACAINHKKKKMKVTIWKNDLRRAWLSVYLLIHGADGWTVQVTRVNFVILMPTA